MKREEILEKIKARAKRNRILRRDPRFRQIIGFLVGKGFLDTNEPVQFPGNRRIRLKDAIWAGQNVEPRILEVLPAAYARLPNRFDANEKEVKRMEAVVQCLAENKPDGPDFLGMPYEKVRAWYTLPLKDQRTRTPAERKVTKTFRLKPEVIKRLEEIARDRRTNSTQALEQLVLEVTG